MNKQNFEYLQAQLTYTGFGQSLTQQLQTGMQKQLPEFTLQHRTVFAGEQITSALHFRKSNQSGLYFFNSYLATLHSGQQQEKLNQRFYIQSQGSITLKEAFNLLQGRAVAKQLLNAQGEQYTAWVQLDFKETDRSGNFKLRRFGQDHGYDLAAQLTKLPLKELAHPDSKANLLDSLRKGNRQQVTWIDGQTEHKLFLEASPQFKAVIAYDQSGLRRQAAQQTQAADASLQQQSSRQHQIAGELGLSAG